VVLCVDEKSQIQTLDRERPVLPMAPGVPALRTHTYVRNGMTSLFAALDKEVQADVLAGRQEMLPPPPEVVL
jgi:hypothetical protein